MVHYKVEFVVGLKCEVHVHDEGGSDLGQNLTLVHDLVHKVPL
jgi:hypothetical protein